MNTNTNVPIVNVTDSYYLPERGRMTKQGKRRDMNKYISQGYEIMCEKNGFFVLAIPAAPIVEFSVNDISGTENIKPLIREYLGVRNVNENRYNSFMEDYKEEKFKLGYTGYGLCLVKI